MKQAIYIIMILLILPIVCSQTIHRQTHTLDIKIPCFDRYKDYCNSSTNCTLTVNRPDGNNIVDNGLMSYNPSYFNYTIEENLLNQTGMYATTIHCNISDDHDYDRFTFEITASGKKADATGTAGISIVIFILFVVLFLLYLGFKPVLVHNEIPNLILRRSCFLLAIYLMILNSTIVATIAGAANLDVTRELFIYMTIFGYAGYIAMIFIMFKTIVDYLKMWHTNKEEKKYGKNYG